MLRLAVLAAALSETAALGVAPRARVAPRCTVTMGLKGPSSKGFGWGSVKLGGIFSRRSGGNQGGGLFGGNGGGNNNKIVRRMSDEAEDSAAAEEPSGIWASYEAALDKNPLLIKGLTSMIGFTLGDMMAQLFIEKKGPYDPIRTARLASFGFLVHGTTSHWFYGKLDGLIPGTSAGAVASKVGIDQILWNPIFGCMFFGYMGLAEGSSLAQTGSKIKRDLMKQVTGSWTVWPLAHAINFKFIPTSQRVLYINSIQIFYNCFLSIIGTKK